MRVLYRRIPTETTARHVLAHTRINNRVGEENILRPSRTSSCNNNGRRMYHQKQATAAATAARSVNDAKAEDTSEHLLHRRMFPGFGMYLKAEKLHLRSSFGFHNTRPDEALLPSATTGIPTAETPHAPISRTLTASLSACRRDTAQNIRSRPKGGPPSLGRYIFQNPEHRNQF